MKNKNMKIISLMIVFISLFVNFNVVPVFAATSGTDASGFTWQSDDGITYSITGYNGNDTNITIPISIDGHTVTSIGSNAFMYKPLTSVTIPNTVTSIGGFAFYYCSSLRSISIPDSVTNIGDSAFAYCISLLNITLPANLSSIGNCTFQDCKAFTGITIPSSVTSIGMYAFVECFSLTNITIPNSVTYIGEGAFKDCKALRSAVMPDSVTNIGNYLFYNCQLLSNVTLSNNLKNTGDFIFYNCFSLVGVTLPNSLTNIGNSAFEDCTALTNIVIPEGVTKIGYRAFIMCRVLENITIPRTVKIIDFNAFAHCYAFTSIVIPDSVTSIGDYAFYYCTSLKEVTIPESVNNIGFLTFNSCSPDFKIKGIGGYAYTYAVSNSIPFEELPSIKYTVTFNSDGGGIIGSIQANNNTLITEPIVPTKTGYTFGGWYKDTSFNNAWNFANDKVTSNIALNAKWTTNQYTVSFDSQGGSGVGNKTTDYNTIITEPTEPTKTGYIFGGWYKDINFNTSWDFINDKVTDNLTLFARWIEKVATNISLSAQPTKTSYIQGQGLDITGAKISVTYNDGTTETVNVTSGMVSGYNASQVGTQTITVTYSGKTTTFTVNVIAKVVTNIGMNTQPTKTSYIQGQSLDVTGAKIVATYNDGTTQIVNVTSGMVSGYNASQVGTQTITVAYNGQTTTFVVNVAAKVVTNIGISAQPTKTSYIQGQSLDVTGAKIVATYNDATTQIVNVTSGMVSVYNGSQVGTQTITVTYSGQITTFVVNVIPNYTVAFNSNGGTAVANKVVTYNNLITALANPIRTGYTFLGWYKDLTFSIQWNFGTDKVTKSTTLYARWKINSYVVAFSSNGGTAVANKVVTYNNLITAPANPIRTGYTFLGWYKDLTFGMQWNFGTDKVTKNTTLYAKWKINSYAVAFNSNGGTAVANKVVTYNNLITAPAKPLRAGYTFLAWYKESTLGTKWNFTIDKITKNTTLYAKWAQNPVAPSTIAISKPLATSAKISWSGVTGVGGYEVWRATSSTGAYTFIATSTGISYTNIALTSGKTYYYKVRSYKIVDGIKVYSGYTTKIVSAKI